MTMYTKENMITVSQGAAFVDSIGVSVSVSVSVPELFDFQSDRYCDISWFF